MPSSYLYGLDHASHDFTKKKSFGKNIFTNAFPVSLAVYIEKEKGLLPNWIEAVKDEQGRLQISHGHKLLSEIIGISPESAFWAFEEPYDGYNRYATGQVNSSDLVVKDRRTGEDLSAFEVKLVVVPTSGTAGAERERQSCELVVRPPSIEQLCFSIAAGYGPGRRHDIGDIISGSLEFPMDCDWSNERSMLERLPEVVDAAEHVALAGLETQRPFLLSAIWRTKGQASVFDDEAFDVIFWSDLAFLQFFLRAAHGQIDRGDRSISRPARSVVWLIKSLWDYSTQGKVTFGRTHGAITYGGQTDKGGSFSGSGSLPFFLREEFLHPRVNKREVVRIVAPEGAEFLRPERRLDGVLAFNYDMLNSEEPQH